ELTDEIVQPKNNHKIEKTEVEEILPTEVDESWPAEDIAAVAELLSSCRDVKVFETDFYPESIEESPFPRNILNQAAQMLPVAKYEEIKGWVIQIKNKNSTPPATTEAVEENPIDPTPETKVVKVDQQKETSIAKTRDRKEPDWSTFPHLTSNDPRAAKNRVEKIADAIANLSISEGADALYSQFKFGEVEWAKENYLTNREIALLEQLNNCKQLNLIEDESGETQSDCRF
ncbi:MAG: hypothetical protein ACFBSE_25020, partial [Prochloraceae cyanobacterium]